MARWLTFVLASGILAATTKSFVGGTATIDPSLKQRFGLMERQNVIVSFTQGIQPIIDQINSMNFSSPSEKRSALTKAQQTFTNGIQGGVQGVLNSGGVPFESFWINNKMSIPNADMGIVNMVSSIPGVASIEKEKVIKVEWIQHNEDLSRLARQSNGMSWGVQKIRADLVWQKYKGKGIVVANIDTGVRYTHESLKGRWRTSYGWYDPYSKTTTPNDQNGHGTHTMGTITGTGGIGVAPEATWIACKGCSSSTCSSTQLYSCGQWIQCPTKPDGRTPDCNQAPNVVSNSWGGGGGSGWYDDIISSWKAAGIIPIFSIGNSGQNGCSSAGSPGDRNTVIGVGSTDSNERISYFSSLGPASDNANNVKPDISAPGGQIRSAWYSNDTAYNTISGTSMACPHVSGVVALMQQKTPSLNYTKVYNAITGTAVTSTLDSTGAKSCGNTGTKSYPNNAFGYGRIDAVNSVNAV